jgi:hypothetical protein
MQLNTNMMLLWLFLISATLAVGQNTAPCPAGSGSGRVGSAGQSSSSGPPAALVSTNTTPRAAAPPTATAAPVPGLAASTPATAAKAPGSTQSATATSQSRNTMARPRTVGSQRGSPSAQTPNRASSAAATALLNSTSPCTPSSNGAGTIPPATGPQN